MIDERRYLQLPKPTWPGMGCCLKREDSMVLYQEAGDVAPRLFGSFSQALLTPVFCE
jgi:hypothetical protein